MPLVSQVMHAAEAPVRPRWVRLAWSAVVVLVVATLALVVYESPDHRAERACASAAKPQFPQGAHADFSDWTVSDQPGGEKRIQGFALLSHVKRMHSAWDVACTIDGSGHVDAQAGEAP